MTTNNNNENGLKKENREFMPGGFPAKALDIIKRHEKLVIFFLLIIIPFSIFWQTRNFDFVWDDTSLYFTDNSPFLELSFDNILRLWKSDYSNMYYPVTTSLWLLLKPIGDLLSVHKQTFNPYVFHLLNIFLHIINGLLVFRLLSIIIKNKWAVFLGTLLFLLHPIQAEAVSWISEARGLLSTAFGVSALLIYFKSAEDGALPRKKILRYILSMFLFIIAVLSKPSIIVLPVIAGIIEIFIFKRGYKQTAIRLLPWFIVIVPVIITVKQSGMHYITPVIYRPLVWMDAINFYLYKVFFPVSLANSYARTPQFLIEQRWFYIEWILPLAILAALWILRKKQPLFLAAFLLFVTGFLPVSGLVPFNYQFWSTVADRYIYFSMIAVALVFAYGLENLKTRDAWIISVIIIALLGLRTYITQVPVWQNSVTLWENCIRVSPEESKAWSRRGLHFSNAGEFGKALEYFNRALSINPEADDALKNRGNMYMKLKDYNKALADYNKSIEIAPEDSGNYYNRGNLYHITGKLDMALKDYNRSIELAPENSTAYLNRGNLYFSEKEYDKALADYSKVIEINPGDASPHLNRGNVYYNMGKYDLSFKEYDMAVKKNPGNPGAYFNRGILLQEMKRYSEAIADYSEIIKIEPAFLGAYVRRGDIYVTLKEPRRALADYNRALELNPEDTQIKAKRDRLLLIPGP